MTSVLLDRAEGLSYAVRGHEAAVRFGAPRGAKPRCDGCTACSTCLAAGMDEEGMQQFEALLGSPLKLRRRQVLYRAGDAFHSLYAVRYGTLKTTVLASDGREHVSGYPMMGDIIGLEGIADGRHRVEAAALESTEVCPIPFDRVEALARDWPVLQHNLHRMMSREIELQHQQMLLLGSMRCSERLALFMLNLAQRYRDHGLPATGFVLRMSRKDIGSHLGMKLETVGRVFAQLNALGLTDVQGRTVRRMRIGSLQQYVDRGS